MSADRFEYTEVQDEELGPKSVLPARREEITLETEDGLSLLGELALPLHVRPEATLVTFHPLPTHGGFMDSHLYKKAAYRLPALADIAVLRFNTRGTSSPRGTSEGEFSDGIDERHDVAAAVRFAVERELPNRWMLGWSFGTELVLRHGTEEPARSGTQGGILLSPPLHRASEEDLRAWNEDGRPLRVLVPEHDDFLKPDEARQRFAPVSQAQLRAVEGAKHLWVGERYSRLVLEDIASTVLGVTADLPTTWTGPMASE
ncbi:alpha/beta hydrolase [Nesterenkonia lutea]|uniref:Alpha/beta superfamily hydrolase n=1 Tax=Nesterenkonia lutea TaxID=272919 RepID=A0ABR9JCV6_9MICC|nr:alpha/beta hydrolase [Nesterenkonia lutea]MBE1523646.1 alpha/beta superfamily hydrolase [Nesterenkonia lutea]